MHNFFRKFWFQLLAVAIVAVAFFIRAWQVTQVPPGLYWDELSLGYDAWSVATTGRDHHDNKLSLLAFESYGDYKPSGYIYTLVPFFWFFEKSDWLVRAPSVLAGVAIVIAIGKLTVWFLSDETKKTRANFAKIWTLIAMSIATFTPSLWHLSRAGWETNLATAYLLWAVVIFLPLLKIKTNGVSLRWRLPLATILFLASFLTYHSTRVVAPAFALFLMITLLWRQRRQIPNLIKKNVLSLLVTVFILVTFLLAALPELRDENFLARFQTENIFTQLEYITASNRCYELNKNHFFAPLLCHRFFYYAGALANNFLSHFNLSYLFIYGESNLRHSPGLFGVYYLTDILPLLAGGFFLWQQRKNPPARFKIIFALFWLIIGLIPSSVTTTVPHLLRSFNLVPLGVVIIGCGWASIGTGLKNYLLVRWLKNLAIIVFAITYLAQIILFANYYWRYYKIVSEAQWQAAYPAAIDALLTLELEQKYPGAPIYFDRALGRASMYYFWYGEIWPGDVQERAALETFDQGEFLTYRDINFIAPRGEGQEIVVMTAESWENYQDQLETGRVCREEFRVVDSRGEIIFYGGLCY